MRSPIVVAILVGSTVVAKADTVQLAAGAPAPLPTIVADQRACEHIPASGLNALVTAQLRVGGVLVRTLQECGVSDTAAYLAIGDHGVWGGTIGYHAANMTAAPTHITLLDARLAQGALASGEAVVVQEVDTLHRAICRRPGCGEESTSREQRVTVCTVPTPASQLTPACTSFSHTCPTSGCAPASLARGRLTLRTQAGTVVHDLRGND